ncbi:MAG: hypothetical protein R3F39_26020, partial [Myxococcota bacterium]
DRTLDASAISDSIGGHSAQEVTMAQLVVRKLNPDIVKALKLRAARHGRSAEAEHRAILEEALRQDDGEAFKAYLLTMPDLGDDADFERQRDFPREVDL